MTRIHESLPLFRLGLAILRRGACVSFTPAMLYGDPETARADCAGPCGYHGTAR